MLRGMSEDEIKTVVREVDEELQKQLVSGRGGSAQLSVIGIVIFLLGLILTIGVHVGFFSSIRSSVALFGYIPIVAGIAMIFVALKRKGRKNSRPFGSRMQDEK